MKIQFISSLALVGAACAFSGSEKDSGPSPNHSHQPCFPLTLTYAFTATLYVGAPLTPITIPGGVLITEPIINGTVRGPLVNATIHGGLAHPSLYENKTVQISNIDFYGISDDGESFYGHDVGVGGKEQINRIELTIGGKHAGIQDEYILSSVSSNGQKTIVTVEAWVVKNKPV